MRLSTLLLVGLPLAFASPIVAPANTLDSVEIARRELTVAKGLERRGLNLPSPGPVAFNGDQCGSSTFENGNSGSSANIDDCKNLASSIRGYYSHWELTNAFGGYSTKWQLLASYGTCQFYVDRSGFFDATTDGKNFVGTTDVADIVTDATARFQKWGTVTYPGGSTQVGSVIPVKGHMGCFPGNWNTPWRIQNGQP